MLWIRERCVVVRCIDVLESKEVIDYWMCMLLVQGVSFQRVGVVSVLLQFDSLCFKRSLLSCWSFKSLRCVGDLGR